MAQATGELAANADPVGFRFAVETLVAADVSQGRPAGHSEVGGIRADAGNTKPTKIHSILERHTVIKAVTQEDYETD